MKIILKNIYKIIFTYQRKKCLDMLNVHASAKNKDEECL